MQCNFALPTEKRKKVLCRQCAQKYTVFSPVKIVPVLPVLRQISRQTGVCIFVRSKKLHEKRVQRRETP